jgi:hypothetical protein
MGRDNGNEASGSTYRKVRATANPIVHLTAAAAAKAAATALLTNQIIKKVRMTLPDGKIARFKVEKCIIESGSAICSIIGTPEAPAEDKPPEVWVRVAWENSISPVSDKTPRTPQILDQRVELHWLTVSQPEKQESAVMLAVPLLIHFIAQTHMEETALHKIPRELVSGAISEALTTIPPDRLENGVRVMIGMAPNSTFDWPNLQTDKEETLVRPAVSWAHLPGLDDNSALSHLALALDNIGEGIMALLTNSDEAYINLPQNKLFLKNVLTSSSALSQLNHLSVCGNLNSVIGVARGELENLLPPAYNNDYLVQLATHLHVPVTIVQAIHDTTNQNDLLRLLNRAKCGWLLDKVCELACQQVRRQFGQRMRIEVIIFGTSGAILGRNSFEPGIFQI